MSYTLHQPARSYRRSSGIAEFAFGIFKLVLFIAFMVALAGGGFVVGWFEGRRQLQIEYEIAIRQAVNQGVKDTFGW